MIYRWLSTINRYTFSIRPKVWKLYTIADALSRRTHVLVTLNNESVAFGFIKEVYLGDEDYKDIYSKNLWNKKWWRC